MILASLAIAALGAFLDPMPVGVPDALLEVTSMPEPSGIVFCPALSRYLIISDDTGDKRRGTNHAPWLFAMSRDGQLDSVPIPILGLEKLNDAEAICEGPAGTYFLATSQSRTREGRQKRARRLTLHLAPDGRGLRLLGSIDLAAAILDSGAVASDFIDIEAMAYRDDTLYVGLKSPQTERGAAIILRISDIQSAFRKGQLDPRKVARWKEVELRAEGAAGPVVQGISDMSFLPDGSLLLLANSPKRMPADGGGALYWLRPDAAPQLLRRFLGQKPEGITLTEDKQALMIVIDRDRQTPLWLLAERPDLKKPVRKSTGPGVKVRKP